jgi:eukaryotic-like serine/threonine-protein kinase
MNLHPSQVIAHRFRLVRELGRGGVGAVWLAHQLALDVPCAVKFFVGADRDLEQYCRRFEIEAKAAARIHHPNVVRILDTGVWEGRPYIAMELLVGEGLDTRLRRRQRLVAAEMVTFCNQVGAALTKAHALGIVHRDLKPSNIFLAREHDRIVVKLIDFGIAKASAFSDSPGSLTRTQTILGTPAYMSPEQIEGTQPLDGRSDLWSLAVIVFECLTGKPPFDAATVGDLFSRITYKPIPVPSHMARGLPPAFDAWWARAAARDVGARFQTSAEFCEALARALGVGHGALSETDAAWQRISTSAMPVVPTSFQPTLSGQARPSSPRPTRSRSGWRLPALVGLVGSVLALAAFGAVFWTTRARPPRPRPADIVSEAPTGMPAPAAASGEVPAPAPSSAATPPSIEPGPEASAQPDPPPSAEPTSTAEPPSVTTAAASAKPTRSRPAGRPRQSSEWGF